MHTKSFEIVHTSQDSTNTRKFKGIASTPSIDRAKDILISEGAKFKLPMPLLFHHNSATPIGHVTDATVTNKGIEVDFEIPDVVEDGVLKSRTDEAYHSLKYNLVNGLSVGFIPEWSEAKENEHGGVTFESWEWYELSLVTTPCNPDAEVDMRKELKNYEQRAALSNDVQTPAKAGDTVEATTIVQLNTYQGGVKL
mgnify:CR=1 FL=1